MTSGLYIYIYIYIFIYIYIYLEPSPDGDRADLKADHQRQNVRAPVLLLFSLRIDSFGQWPFSECSYISSSRCIICKFYTSLEMQEFSLSYHMD